MPTKISTELRKRMAQQIADLFENGVICLYSGKQPNSPEDEATGELLCMVTPEGVPHSSTAGVVFEPPITISDGSVCITKLEAVKWKGTALKNGAIGWGRLCDKNYVEGTDATAIRIDGQVSTNQATAFTTNNITTITGVDVFITNFRIAFGG